MFVVTPPVSLSPNSMSQALGTMVAMCIMCEGASHDEVLFDIHGAIERHGVFIQGVQAKPVERAWAYTIGLSDGFDHPEFVVVGRSLDEAAVILNGLSRTVMAGTDRYRAGETTNLPHKRTGELVEVRQQHFHRGLLAMWDSYYRGLGRRVSRRALQIVDVDTRYCRCHQPARLRLDDPSVRLG
jgi:hypothetical protein